VSLFLVVSRMRPDDGAPEQAPGSRGWADWLAGGISEDNGELSVAYAAHPTDADAAAGQALRAGYRDVVVIPVADATAFGDPDRVAAELDELHALLESRAHRHRGARVVLVGRPPDTSPTFAEILAVLHPPDSADPELLRAAIDRAFDGETERFGRFARTLQQGVPPGTQLALRGSAIQGYSFRTLAPFDARGPGTSDLDVVLFGSDAMAAWNDDAYFVPGVNTLPLSDENPDLAPDLEPARVAAQAIARRPVAIQAMARWFLDLRSGLQGQPYVVIDA
jgi:hypothetical protein